MLNKIELKEYFVHCRYCDKEYKASGALKNHEYRCPLNKDRVYVNGMTGKKQSTKHAEALKRINQNTPIEVKRKRALHASMTIKWSEERRKLHSEIMQEVVRSNPESYSSNNVCGRVKIVEYDGRNLKGSWEVKLAIWLNSIGVEWQSEVNPQEYYWNDTNHLYFPDFFITEYDIYIEVKGYKRERDIAKWSQFKGTLFVVDKSIIEQLPSFSSIEDLMRASSQATILGS